MPTELTMNQRQRNWKRKRHEGIPFHINHKQCGNEQERTMANVTKHDGEFERKGDHSKYSRINFAIAGNTIG
jgi:hypothetical protein